MIMNLLRFFLGGLSINYLIICFLAIFLGAFVSFTMIITGQKWAKNYGNITTYCILPLVGLVISNVISGNIALALGMVGALSIVRFRHPVKSPLELTIYFLLLTIGITLTTNVGKALVLTFLSMSIIYVISWARKKFKSSFKILPELSFVRESPEYILDVSSKVKQNILTESPFLLFSYENEEEQTYKYKLAFGNKKDYESIKKEIELKRNINEVKFTCV